MNRVEEFFAEVPGGLGDEMSRALPEDVCVVFELTEGGTEATWVLCRDEDRVRILRRAPRRPDCRLSCTAEDFLALVGGQLDGTEGFMSGRLQVEGDVGLILALQRIVVPRT